LIFTIAARNAIRQKRRTVLTALTMFGGFVLAAISIGWSDGTYSYIINMFTRNRLGHIQVHREGYLDRPSIYKTISNYRAVGEAIGGTRYVEEWTPRLFAAGLASVGDKSTAVQITGVIPEKENKATLFSEKIIKGRPLPEEPSGSAVIGAGLSEVLEADIGDEVVVVSQAADGAIANAAYIIAGFADTGNVESDRTSLYLHLDEAQELFALQDRVHEIAVIVSDLDLVRRTADLIRQNLNNEELSVAPWQEFARSFYIAMQADVQGMWIMIFIIILIVAVGVLNTVLMNVLERMKEYGILKAIGTKPTAIFFQVMIEVSIIAAGSIAAGALISLIVNSLLSGYGIPLPFSFTYGGVKFDTMYSEVNLRSFLIPAVTVLVSSIVISMIPAFKAAGTAPAEAMRAK